MRSLVSLAPLAALLAAAGAIAAPLADPFASFEEFHAGFRSLELDSSRVAHVQSLLIQRDAGTIVLEDGVVVLAKPFAGRVCAGVFIGRGSFAFVPPTEIERQQLRRFYGTTSLRRSFRSATLFFADSTLEELREAATFARDTVGRVSTRALADARAFLTDRRTRWVDPDFAQTLLDGSRNGLFHAQLDLVEGEPLFFRVNPYRVESIQLLRRREDDRQGMYRRNVNEVVCQFSPGGGTDTTRSDTRAPYAVRHTAVDMHIANDLDLDATTTLTLRTQDPSRRWLLFTLDSELKIDTLIVDGAPARVFQEKDDDYVWVRCEPPLVASDSHRVVVRYAGKSFEREGDWIYHRAMLDWYPQTAYPALGTFDLHFRSPVEIQLVASGERVLSERHELESVSRWVTTTPTYYASFDLNFLRGARVSVQGLPPLTVWMRHVDGAGRMRDVTPEALGREKGYDAEVTRDMLRALAYYLGELGAPPAASINAVETPLLTYVAFPGLVHMMRPADRPRPGVLDSPDFIRAHELAHQWWGLGVAPATYHDSWLSEGFANFFAAWYVQAGRRDQRGYFEVLESWRKELLENRKFLLGNGQQAGPIWLGGRTSSSSTPDDYSIVVYGKGAWVLHMIRNLLLDERTSDDEKFRNLMRDFYRERAGRSATTEDFRAAVERAAGVNMRWFFDQWVYGTDVPTYRFSYRTEPADGGRWRVVCRIEQSNVPATFRMPVLVRVEFPDGSFVRTRVEVGGAATEYELPLLPSKPANVVFNDLQSVLCEVTSPAKR